MQIKIKKLTEKATLPTRGSEYAAGYDLYAAEEVEVPAGECKMIHTGIAVAIPEGYFGAIYARSGLAAKQGIRPANCVGVVDSDYRGEVMVAARNDNNNVIPIFKQVTEDTRVQEVIQNDEGIKIIHAGDRIAQLIIQKFEEIDFDVVDELEDTDRGEGGFGSTGTN